MPTVKFKSVIANVAGERLAPGLGSQIREYDPHLITLTEAYRIKGSLKRKVFSNYSYEHITHPDYDCPVLTLVRDDCRWVFNSPVKMKLGWNGPTGRKREPRLYNRGRINVHGTPIRYMGVHFEPFGINGRNSNAWAQSMRRVNTFLNATPKTFSVAQGDFNDDMFTIARCSNKSYTLYSKSKVDHFITNIQVRGLTQRLELPKNSGKIGFHGWSLSTFYIPVGD